MTRLYTGLQRQGKTQWAVYDIIYGHMIYGRRIISNTPLWCNIKGRKVYADFYGKDDERYKYEFLKAEGALIFNDEMSLYFSSLKWNKLGMDFFQKFRQGGKQGCDLYGTTQSLTDTIASIRRVADQFCVCRKSFWLIPVGIDLRYNRYNKKRGFYDLVGPYYHFPMVYRMLKVLPGWFASKAQLAKNREQFVIAEKTMYPSTANHLVRPYYDHSYIITGSAVAKLEQVQQYSNWDEYREAMELTPEEREAKKEKSDKHADHYTDNKITSRTDSDGSNGIESGKQPGTEEPNITG